MKPILPFILLLFSLLGAQIGRGQGSVTFLSNLGQPSSGSVAIGSDSSVAAGFFTGGNAGGYFLNSIQLSITDPSGDPSSFTVMIYGYRSVPGTTVPGANLGTLTGSSNPATSGVYTYEAPPGLILSPGYYYIVITANSAVAVGAYDWSLAGINSYNPSGGWAVTAGVSSDVLQSANGSSWTSLSATYPQFAINATAAPEPGTLGLLALGVSFFGLWRRNEKKRS